MCFSINQSQNCNCYLFYSPLNTYILSTSIFCCYPEVCESPKEDTECYCKRTCETEAMGDLYTCPQGDSCVPGCECPQGMIEDSNGKCIHPEDCYCYDECSKEVYLVSYKIQTVSLHCILDTRIYWFNCIET